MDGTGKRIVVGVSGASGVVYGRRLIDVLEAAGCVVHVVVSGVGAQLLIDELGVKDLTDEELIGRASKNVVVHDNTNMFDVLASGSSKIDGMVVCPCSSHSVASIASGICDTLLLRSAYVTLKQRRRLVLVHREMPLTAIDLDNMVKVTQAGGIICPASPGFYMAPQTIGDLVDSVVGRVMDLLGVDHDLAIRWGE